MLPTATTGGRMPRRFRSRSTVFQLSALTEKTLLAQQRATDDLTCGNGTLDPGEECDDGNESDGDGCDRDCSISLCTGGGPVGAIRLVLSHLGGVPADDRLRLTADLALPVGTVLDPITDGLQLRIVDTGTPGRSMLDLSRLSQPIPPGGPGSGCALRDGWQPSGAGYSYRNT